jgi:DNA-dependent RNA polymerase auxiliary subunit epsilon
MARHNRDGSGEDQLGRSYKVSYQPDWFYQVKVTRDLPSGRQSTKTLFRNPEAPQGDPGPRVRTRIESEELGIEFEISIEDPLGALRRITIEAVSPVSGENVGFTVSRARRRASP